MELKDLERRAMLGDRQAQEECSRQGIAIPCWRCGGEAEVKQLNTGGKPVYAVSCEKHYCGAYGCAHPTVQKAIEYWNTRPAPPIGRCKQCGHFTKDDFWCDVNKTNMENSDFCSYFEEAAHE